MYLYLQDARKQMKTKWKQNKKRSRKHKCHRSQLFLAHLHYPVQLLQPSKIDANCLSRFKLTPYPAYPCTRLSCVRPFLIYSKAWLWTPETALQLEHHGTTALRKKCMNKLNKLWTNALLMHVTGTWNDSDTTALVRSERHMSGTKGISKVLQWATWMPSKITSKLPSITSSFSGIFWCVDMRWV